MGDKCEGVGLMIVGPRGAKTVMACKPQEISLSRKQQQCVCASGSKNYIYHQHPKQLSFNPLNRGQLIGKITYKQTYVQINTLTKIALELPKR